MLITPTSAIVGSVVGIGGGLAYLADQKTKQSKQRQAEAEARHRFDNTVRMIDEWSDLSSSREAVLHKRHNSDSYFNLHKLIAKGNRSKVDQSTPVPDSVADVMRFFLLWEYLEKRGTINSADLKEYLEPEFDTVCDILTEIRDEEAEGWHQIDSDRLNDVLRFLDEVSKMKTEG